VVGYDFKLVDAEFDKVANSLPSCGDPKMIYVLGWLAANEHWNRGVSGKRGGVTSYFEVDNTHFNKMCKYCCECSNSKWFHAGWFAFLSFMNGELERLFHEAIVDD
jgi:hypothetical protein